MPHGPLAGPGLRRLGHRDRKVDPDPSVVHQCCRDQLDGLARPVAAIGIIGQSHDDGHGATRMRRHEGVHALLGPGQRHALVAQEEFWRKALQRMSKERLHGAGLEVQDEHDPISMSSSGRAFNRWPASKVNMPSAAHDASTASPAE